MMRVNGKSLTTGPERLLDLLAELGFGAKGAEGQMSNQGVQQETRGIAVAINGTVVPRSQWAATRLSDGDDVEIVKIMQGG